ncbi:hypothetical protein JTB14_010894 [Gonioctena quinquepunctata]|nr:hypothetical protein JTB14_010894 [Gonioctena quinquepunctata]
MNKSWYVIFVLCVFGLASSRELHPIEPKPGKCFDSYEDVQPINLSDLTKACVEKLPTKNECFGLKLATDEIIIVGCREDGPKLEKGCYRFFNKDLSEDVICQKYKRRTMCEIINTPANLAIEVHCDQSEPGIVMVQKLKDVI